MAVVFLPTGRCINNPDSIKLVHIIRNEVYGKVTFLLSVKLDDDAELLIDSVGSEKEALALADKCIDLINAAANDEEMDFDDEDEDEAPVDEVDDAAEEEEEAAAEDDDDDDWDDDDW
jgi:hypothetical protein